MTGERAGEPIVRVQGLVKVFGEGASQVRAVDGVDLEVWPGELILIMGPSGSGKTTLLSLVGGLLRPSAGRVVVGGTEVSALSERQLPAVRRHLVGFIFQSFNLLEALDVRENVEIALNLAGVGGQEAREQATAVLARLGLGARLRFKTRSLSGGEKQRVSIARAIVNRPRLVLADEPTANLDSKHGYEVMKLLRTIAHEGERAVVAVSHDQRIRAVADRVLWLEDGRLTDMARMERDPVCGMDVEPGHGVVLEEEGRVVTFCSEGCRAEYATEPARFAGSL
ncbi:MAG: ATP-binding cassette domain-containing protein [Dehalococcoidia bacterium]|nr:ATP-binding cassette domain-containing protein [Dehalococcoidia bacterium]